MNILKTKQKEGCLFITVEVTNIDSSNYITVKAKILATITNASEAIFVDLSNINYIDSWGIGALISIHSNIDENQIFTIICPQKKIYENLKAAGLNNYFNIIHSNDSKCPICSEDSKSCVHLETICEIFAASKAKKAGSRFRRIVRSLTGKLNSNGPVSRVKPVVSRVVKSVTSSLRPPSDNEAEKVSTIVKMAKNLTGSLDAKIFKKLYKDESLKIDEEPVNETKNEIENNEEEMTFKPELPVKQDSIMKEVTPEQHKHSEQAPYIAPDQLEIPETDDPDYSEDYNYKRKWNINDFVQKNSYIISGLFFVILIALTVYMVQIDAFKIRDNKGEGFEKKFNNKFTPEELLIYDMDKDGKFTKDDWYRLSPQTRIDILKEVRKRKKNKD